MSDAAYVLRPLKVGQLDVPGPQAHSLPLNNPRLIQDYADGVVAKASS